MGISCVSDEVLEVGVAVLNDSDSDGNVDEGKAIDADALDDSDATSS